MLLVRLDDAHGLAEPRLQDVGAGDVLRVLAARPDDDAAFEERSASLQDAAAVASPLSSARAPDPPAMRAFSGVSTLSNRLI